MAKKCPNGHEVNDNLKFCPKCGAELIESGNRFCKKCGTERKGTEKFCSKCGTPFDGFSMTQPTSQSTPSYDEGETSTDYKKIIIPIVIGLIVLALIGGGWYGYNAYSKYSAAKQAREKFVADSLEQVRKDSIKLAEQKEQERIEAEKVEKFREKMSFENFIGMLNHYENQSYANKCGLNLLYRSDTEEEYGTSTEIVYGYDVEKGSKKDYGGYDIVAKSNHACYFMYMLDTSTGAQISFKDSDDADILFKKAKEYGLIIYEDMYYIPNKRLPNGKSIRLAEYDNSIYERVCGTISAPDYINGWYVIHIGIDF